MCFNWTTDTLREALGSTQPEAWVSLGETMASSSKHFKVGNETVQCWRQGGDNNLLNLQQLVHSPEEIEIKPAKFSSQLFLCFHTPHWLDQESVLNIHHSLRHVLAMAQYSLVMWSLCTPRGDGLRRELHKSWLVFVCMKQSESHSAMRSFGMYGKAPTSWH